MNRWLCCVPAMLAVGCFSGGGGSWEEEEPIYIDDFEIVCDPTQSSWDDLFWFEVWTSGPVRDVELEISYAGDFVDRFNLRDEGQGYWYREEWADDLGLDCDDFDRLRFFVEADGRDGQSAEAEARG